MRGYVAISRRNSDKELRPRPAPSEKSVVLRDLKPSRGGTPLRPICWAEAHEMCQPLLRSGGWAPRPFGRLGTTGFDFVAIQLPAERGSRGPKSLRRLVHQARKLPCPHSATGVGEAAWVISVGRCRAHGAGGGLRHPLVERNTELQTPDGNNFVLRRVLA